MNSINYINCFNTCGEGGYLNPTNESTVNKITISVELNHFLEGNETRLLPWEFVSLVASVVHFTLKIIN